MIGAKITSVQARQIRELIEAGAFINESVIINNMKFAYSRAKHQCGWKSPFI
jgi:hypothetical protein